MKKISWDESFEFLFVEFACESVLLLVQYNPEEFIRSRVALIEFSYKRLQTKQGFVILIINANTFKGSFKQLFEFAF